MPFTQPVAPGTRPPGQTKTVPTRIVRALLQRLTQGCQAGRVTVRFADGRVVRCGGDGAGPQAIIEIHRLRALRRLLAGGFLGLAEGYMAGDWSTPSLGDVLDFGAANAAALNRTLTGGRWHRATHALMHFARRNSRTGSRRNIARHYDLGNDFYAAWLDPGMTYSAALFEAPGQTLDQAQAAKNRRILDVLALGPGDHILEIGCGWGGFAEFAAREAGAKVTAITISKAQHDYARARIGAAGLGEHVDVRLADYRDVTGRFDRVVSIEMLEAVGEAYWPRFFATVSARLRPGGSALLQAITVPDQRFSGYRKTVDFIQKYIFPGGMLPCPGIIRAEAARAGLAHAGDFCFGASYARTLDHWRTGFHGRWPAIAVQGFDRRFKRMWDYYLASTAAGFRAGIIDVGQYHLVKP